MVASGITVVISSCRRRRTRGLDMIWKNATDKTLDVVSPPAVIVMKPYGRNSKRMRYPIPCRLILSYMGLQDEVIVHG